MTAKEFLPLVACKLLTAIPVTPTAPRPVTQPWVPVSKSQLPQLGFPPVPRQLNVVPRHVLLQPPLPQAALALAWVQSVQVVDVTAQRVVSLFAEHELMPPPQKCCAAMQPQVPLRHCRPSLASQVAFTPQAAPLPTVGAWQMRFVHGRLLAQGVPPCVQAWPGPGRHVPATHRPFCWQMLFSPTARHWKS